MDEHISHPWASIWCTWHICQVTHILAGPTVCEARLCVRDPTYMPGTRYNFCPSRVLDKNLTTSMLNAIRYRICHWNTCVNEMIIFKNTHNLKFHLILGLLKHLQNWSTQQTQKGQKIEKLKKQTISNDSFIYRTRFGSSNPIKMWTRDKWSKLKKQTISG